MVHRCKMWVLCTALLVAAAGVHAVPDAVPSPPRAWSLRLRDVEPAFDVYDLSFPSPVTTPWPENNTVYCVYHRVRGPGSRPAVVVLHALRVKKASLELALCRRLAERGIHALLVTLPYHMGRRPSGTKSGAMFVTSDLRATSDAMRQAAVDVTAAVSWLCRRPEVDPNRIGAAGVSLGAILTHLVMGLDPRLRVGAAVLGGGDLGAVMWDGIAVLPVRRALEQQGYTRQQVQRELADVDPLTYADRNHPRRVLMVAAGRDQVIPLRCTLELNRALGSPPITWLNTGHFGIGLAPNRVFRLAADYLAASFHGRTFAAPQRLHMLPVKMGPAFGLDSRMTGCVGFELLGGLEETPGRPLLHMDLLLAGTGAYLSVGASIRNDLEVGYSARLLSGRTHLRPYAMISFLL